MTKFIMMAGLPGSGKSHYIKTLKNMVIHSSDSIRKELYGDENIQGKSQEVFGILHKRIKRDLKNGLNVVYDACNINYKRRKAFLEELNKIECYKECCLIATPYEQCIERNKLRDRQVPEHVINKMYKNFFIPQKYEGWDDINIEWNCKKNDYSLAELFNELYVIKQDNPHHTLTIGNHCLKARDFMCGLTDDYKLIVAAILHDIGKLETKEFKNYKGEATEHAHFYQHHLVSAYNSLFYLYKLCDDDEDILAICNYVQWHMQPFFIETEKAKTKFIKLVGEEFYNNLMKLHSADKMAH